MPFTEKFYSETWPNGYAFAKLIIPALQDHHPIDSVVDIGCGAGGFLKWCLEQGMTVRGVEIDENAYPVMQVPVNFVHAIDMSKSARFMVKFDVCVSLEVAEHLPEECADTFIDNLCLASDIVIFSAARPGQPGEGHINCQDKEYWITKFQKRGYSFLSGLSGLLRGNVDIPTYYRENSLVFIKILKTG